MKIGWIEIKQIIIPSIIGFGLLIKIVYDYYQKNIKEKKIKKSNKNKYIEIEKITQQIVNLEYKIIKDQLRIVTEISDLMYSSFLEIYNKKLDIEKNEIIKLGIKLKLNEFRKKTDEIMKQVVYHNGIAEKNEDDWNEYKKRKQKWIFQEIKLYAEQIHKKEIFQMNYYDFAQKIINDIESTYYTYVNIMFQDIRSIAKKINKEILSLKVTLKKLQE